MNTIKRHVLALAIFTAHIPLCGAVDLNRQVDFAIQAQKLDAALMEFSRQAKVQVIASTAQLQNLSSAGATGNLTISDALKKLLANSGLVFTPVGDSAISIGKSGEARSDSAPLTAIHLARVPQDEPEQQRTKEDATNSQDAKGTPEILVQGKRSINADIERTRDDPQPYVVFDRETIQRSQAMNLEDFLRTRLPMNTASATNAQTPGSSNTSSSINLRGLGVNQTLILIDGRRLPGVASFGGPVQSDINGVPMSAVERIEVLPSTAGGIYGGSATGGVVNVILRKDFTGFETRATYANTLDSDAGSTLLEATGSFNLEGGRTQVMASASYSTANELLFRDRDFSQRAIHLQDDNNSNAIYRLATPPLGSTVNILSNTIASGVRQNLTLDPEFGGGALNSPFTHLPPGYPGPDSDDGLALIRNAGSYNLDMPPGPIGSEQTLIASPEKRSATLNVRRDFTGRLQAFIDVSSFGDRGRGRTGSTPTFVRNLSKDSPFNPFQQNINVRFPIPGLTAESTFESTTLRATGGLIARLPYQWTGEIDYGWSRSRSEAISTPSRLDFFAGADFTSGVLNPLQETNTFPFDFTDYLLPTPARRTGPSDTTLKDATVRLSGPAFNMPAGALTLSALIERRKETVEDFYQDTDTFTHEQTYFYYPPRSQQVDSYYLEGRAPLISPRAARAWARELELQASVRRDEYRTRSDGSGGHPVDSRDGPFPSPTYTTSRLVSDDYTLGLRYAPVADIVFRASLGTGFLPPTVAQIVSSTDTFDFPLDLIDPKRDFSDTYVGEPLTYISGGNPDLQPEESRTWSAGVIFTPRFAPDLRLSIDYTHIAKTGEIQVLDDQTIIDNEDFLPGRVVRGEKLEDDPEEWAGPIVALNSTYLNIARTSVSAYDIQTDYLLHTERFADFHWYAIATWQQHYKTQITPSAARLELVDFDGGYLEWRGNVGVNWERGPFTFGWNAQYYNSYRVYLPGADELTRETAVFNQGSNRIPRQIYHDLIASFRFDDGRSEISLGVQNVFDHSPPILVSTVTTSPGYSTYGDARLRRYTLSLRKSFGSR